MSKPALLRCLYVALAVTTGGIIYSAVHGALHEPGSRLLVRLCECFAGGFLGAATLELLRRQRGTPRP